MQPPDCNQPSPRGIDDSIREAAASWIVRRDRGLSARESIEFELWLADDERHAEAIRRSTAAWALLDRLPDSVGELQVNKTRRTTGRIWLAIGGIAAALVLSVFAWWARPALGGVGGAESVAGATHVFRSEAADARQFTLSDGTIVRLNAGTELVERFTPEERRVQIMRGEAHFSVTKNPRRPFVVRAGTVNVRAVGTAFNVNLLAATVEVLVTEGAVQVKSAVAPTRAADSELTAAGGTPLGAADSGSRAGTELPPIVAAGQRAVISLTPGPMATAVSVAPVKPEEIAQALAWQSALLRLGGATLAELALEFQRNTGHVIRFSDPELAAQRIGGRFRADDVDGFVRLLEENYGVKSQRSADGSILLRRAP